MSDEYQVFSGKESTYALHAPTSQRVQDLMRIELRARTSVVVRSATAGRGDGQASRIKIAEQMGFDPAKVIPDHSRVEEEGEESVEITGDVEWLSHTDYLREAAEIIFIGVDDAERGDLRLDTVQEAIGDFTRGALGMNMNSRA